MRQNREQKAFFAAKDRVYLRTKGLQQFLNAGEIPMLERNLKIAPGWGNNLCHNAWFCRNFATASIQVDVLITVSIDVLSML